MMMNILPQPEVVDMTVPTGEIQTPRAVVAVRYGDVVLRATVRCLSRSRLNVAPPWAGYGSPGVEFPRPIWEAVEGAALAAVQSDSYAAIAMMAKGRPITLQPGRREDYDGNP